VREAPPIKGTLEQLDSSFLFGKIIECHRRRNLGDARG